MVVLKIVVIHYLFCTCPAIATGLILVQIITFLAVPGISPCYGRLNIFSPFLTSGNSRMDKQYSDSRYISSPGTGSGSFQTDKEAIHLCCTEKRRALHVRMVKKIITTKYETYIN